MSGKDGAARFVRYETGQGGALSSAKRTPDAVGKHLDLNRIDGLPPGRESLLEDEFFKTVDDRAAKILTRMMAEEHIKATEAERSDWSRFLISLLTRFPESVTGLTSKLNNTLDRLHEIYERRLIEIDIKDAEPRSPAEHASGRALATFKLLTSVVDSGVVGEFLNNMYWRRLDCQDAKHYLLTSDRPVFFDKLAGQGRARLLLAISPTMMFVADKSKSDADRFIYDVNDLVTGYNDQITRQARRFVIGREDGKNRFVAKRLGKSTPQHVGEEDLRRIPTDFELEEMVSVALGSEPVSGQEFKD